MAKTALLLKSFYPVAREYLIHYSKKAGIPDEPLRQTQLDLLAALTRAMANALKIVFQHDYDGSRFHYARHRDRIYTCAFRILELIKLEQRILGLRYQALPARAWQDANTIFQVMATYENVEFPLPLLHYLTGKKQGAQSASLHDIYVAIQTYVPLDPTTWPVEQHAFIDSYRDAIDKPVTVALDAGGDFEPDTLLAHCYQNHPPLGQRPDDLPSPVMAINCRVLADNVRKDYRGLIRAKAQNNTFLVPRSLAPLKDEYQLSIASLMYRNIKQKIWMGEVDQIGEPMRNLHIYVGFKEIFLHLRGIFERDQVYQDSRRLADSLAERSALFGEDHSADRQSLWHVIYSDKRRLRLKTQESRFTTPLSIGSLVAYGVGNKDRRRPRLGAISRIFRPKTGTAVIDMDRLASYAEPVKVGKNTGEGHFEALTEAERTAMVVFLIFDRNSGWGLLLPRQNRLWEGSRVTMERQGKRLDFELGKARTLTQRFFLFGLPQEIRGLGAPEYPLNEAGDPAQISTGKGGAPGTSPFPTR